MFKRILVPLDGSSFGEAALPPAVAMARKSGGKVRLVSVYEPGLSPSRADVHARLRRWRAEYLTRVAGTYLGLSVSTDVLEGLAETQILEEADAWGADVIVMSTHGRGAVSRFWLGSVADHCLRSAHRPLLLVRARPSAMSQGDPLFAPKRIVVPLDGSELAERALDSATALAETFGATLSLVRVVPELTSTAPIRLEHASTDRRDTEVAVARAREYVHKVAESMRGQGWVITSEVIAGQHPAQAIIDYAAGDLVVMATHSRSLTQRALLGSVTDKVVRGTRGNVLAIPVMSAFDEAGEEAQREATAEQRSLPVRTVVRRVAG